MALAPKAAATAPKPRAADIVQAWADSLAADAAPPLAKVHPLTWLKQDKVPELLAALKQAGIA